MVISIYYVLLCDMPTYFKVNVSRDSYIVGQ